MTLKQTVEAIQNGNLKSVDLVSQSLEKISNSKTNAFVEILAESSLQKAKEIDLAIQKGEKVGALAGIPVGIKENICVEGSKSTCASNILKNFVPPYNATATQKLLDAGAIVVGKLNMDEFAMGSTSESSAFGPVLNPQAPDRTPGGSSGGSAAAVAEGLVNLTLGSDTGGSIRQPAACCGIVGLKPTYGRISRYGLIAYASSLDQIGPLTHSVEDAAYALNLLAGHDLKDSTSSQHPVEDFTSLLDQDIKGKVIGVPKEYFTQSLESSQRESIEATLKAMEREGALLREVSLPNLEYAIASYYVIATAEASSNLSRFDGVRYSTRSETSRTLEEMFSNSRSEGFGEEVKRRILLGTFVLSSGYYDAYYLQAQKVRRLIANDFKAAFEQCDVIASPTMPGHALKLGESGNDPFKMYLSDIYTVSLNLAGLPGISLPCGTSEGLKVGLQLIGKAFDETQLLQVASAAERLRVL